MVKRYRYDMMGVMPDPRGRLVEYWDYHALEEENTNLKDVIILECDHFVALAAMDELGNYARFVRRMAEQLGDVIPELKDFAKELGVTDGEETKP